MEPILAEQAIDRKLEMIQSVIVGNYEYYYAAGILTTYTDLQVDGSMKPQEMMQVLQDTLKECQGETERQQFLLRIMLRYEVDDRYDEEIMPQLFETGRKKGIRADG